MSGHSKWSNIKNRKAAMDKKRSKLFTRCAKEIMVAIRQGGGNVNPEVNSMLRSVIEKARQVNMPKENIMRLLDRFQEKKDDMVSILLEGYGCFSVPILVEVETDNKNRILAEVNTIFRKFDGNLGENGSVKFQFDRVGEIEVDDLSEEAQLALIDVGGVKSFEERRVLVEAEKLDEVVEKAEGMGLRLGQVRLTMKVKAAKELTMGQKERLGDLVSMLEENEDVISVFVGAIYV